MHFIEENLKMSEVVTELRKVTSLLLVAVIAQVTDGQTIVDWQQGESEPFEGQKVRLVQMYNMVKTLQEAGKTDLMIKEFFMGENPHLKHQPPALVIRDGDFDQAWAAVLNSAAE